MAALFEALEPFDVGDGALVATSAGGARGAGDPNAKTLLASREQTAALNEAARAAKLARPTIVGLTLIGLALGTALLVDAVAAAIRLVGEGRDLTGVEVVLTGVGACLVVATPALLWIRWIAKKIWGSTPRSVNVARRLKSALLGSTAAYGSAALGIHVFEAVLRRQAASLASPVWNLLLFAVAMVGAAAAWFWGELARRRA
jgi:hypothetical protein